MVKVVVLVKDGSSTQLERSRKNCHLACVVTFASMSPFSGSTINSEYEFYRCTIYYIAFQGLFVTLSLAQCGALSIACQVTPLLV